MVLSKRTTLTTTIIRTITDNAHKSDAVLAQMTGMSRVGVWKVRKRYKLPKPKENGRKTPKYLIKLIRRNKNKPSKEISEMTGYHHDTITRIKRKLKLNKNENSR